jgi:hypothetical protein
MRILKTTELPENKIQQDAQQDAQQDVQRDAQQDVLQDVQRDAQQDVLQDVGQRKLELFYINIIQKRGLAPFFYEKF